VKFYIKGKITTTQFRP